MRPITIPNPLNIPQQWDALVAQRATAMIQLDVNAKREYIRTHQGWATLKAWLQDLSAGKCWYCESRTVRAPLDVDHFRPKLSVTVDTIPVALHRGYWWLAYDWRNYRLSCQRCNRPFTNMTGQPSGKRDEFPLRDEGARAFAPEDALELEEPRLLDPCDEADTSLLEHCWDGEVRPSIEPSTWEWERATYTIKQLGLDEPALVEEKRGRWVNYGLLLRLSDQGIVSSAEIQDCFRRLLQPDAEYSAFFRSAIRTHRDRPWIEAML